MALSRSEIRLLAMETLIAFQFAGRHLQTADPAHAIEQLRRFLKDPAHISLYAGLSASDMAALSAELENSVDRIVRMQQTIPARLVD